MTLGEDAPAAATLYITRFNTPRHYITSKKNTRLMFQPTESFFKNDQKSTTYQTNFLYRMARSLLGKLHIRHLKQNNGKFPTFALHYDKKVQQTKNIRSMMSLCFSTKCPFDKYLKAKLKKRRQRLTREKRLLLMVELHLSPVEKSCSKQGVLGGNAAKDNDR